MQPNEPRFYHLGDGDNIHRTVLLQGLNEKTHLKILRASDTLLTQVVTYNNIITNLIACVKQTEEGRERCALELCHFLGVKENSGRTVGAKARRQRSAKYVW